MWILAAYIFLLAGLIFGAFAWAIIPAKSLPKVQTVITVTPLVVLEKEEVVIEEKVIEKVELPEPIKPKLCVIYACCHGRAVEYLLKQVPAFDQDYKIVRYENIWFQKDDPLPMEYISKADLFIYNVVSNKGDTYNSNNVKKLLPSHCKTISLPYGYDAGIWGISSIWRRDLLKKGNIIWECKEAGMSLDEILTKYKSGTLDVRYEERHQYSMDVLLQKESETDCHMHPIFLKYFKTHRLFLTINHPTLFVFVHVTNQILEILGINHVFDTDKYCYDENSNGEYNIEFLPPKEECIYKLAPFTAWLLSKWDVAHWQFDWKKEPDVGADEYYEEEIRLIYESV